MREKSLSLQGLVNTYPHWATIRNDMQSSGQQLLNPIGIHFDDLQRQIARLDANFHLGTSIASDIGIYYQYRLPRDYEFVFNSEETESQFIPPVVEGTLDDGTVRQIELATDNSLENWWYKSDPTRAEVDLVVVGTSTDHLVLRDTATHSPFVPAVFDLPYPNQLLVTVSGVTSCLQEYDGKAVIGTINILGETREGASVSEDVVFFHGDSLRTLHEFASVSGVVAYGFSDPEDAQILITSADFRNDTLQTPRYHKTAYNLGRYETVSAETMPLFWTLARGESTPLLSQTTLELHRYDADQLQLRLDGFLSISKLLAFDLVDTAGIPINPVDLAPEPWSRNIWMVDPNYLYLFTDEIPYPSLKTLEDKTIGADAKLDISADYAVSGQDVSVDYVWARPTVGIQQHRAWMIKPDGTWKSLEYGVQVTYHTDDSSWIYGEPDRRMLRPTEVYTLDQPGEFTFALEVIYTNLAHSLDKRVVYVSQKQARARFSIQALTGSAALATGVDVDYDQRLWIRTDDGKRHRILCHYDRMLIDTEKKVIFFREPYTKVRVLS